MSLPPAPDATRRAQIAARTEALFRGSGALIDGHFSLKSGRHADRYLEKFQVLQFPDAVVELCGFIADRARGADGTPAVDVVVGPTTGGVLLAFEVARQLGVRGIFAEEVKAADGTAHREFRRGFTIGAGERVLLVDDILTTGGSLLAMLPAIEVTWRRSPAGRGDRGSVRRHPRRDLAGQRSHLPGRCAVDARRADLGAGPGHLPCLCGRGPGAGARVERDHHQGLTLAGSVGRSPSQG